MTTCSSAWAAWWARSEHRGRTVVAPMAGPAGSLGLLPRPASHVLTPPLSPPLAPPRRSTISGQAPAWRQYVKSTWSEAHPDAPKLDDKLFQAPAPAQVRLLWQMWSH